MTDVETPSTQRGLRYEPSLDGLRAIAVLLVFAAHSGIGNRHGAEAGVGLFFVLSGYLITRILIAEHDDRGGVRFGRFYARRMLRLYPALCAFALVVGGVYALGHDPARAGRSVAALLGYVPNLYQSWSATPMSAAFGHTWSLGVEEQFYAIWPIVLLAAMRFRPRPRAALLLIAAGMCALFRWQLDRHGYNAYYLPTSWADALVIGSVAAMFQLPRRLAHLGWLAAALLAVLTIHGWNDRALYAGGFTLVAVANLVLVVAALSRWRKPLSFGPLVWLGRRSYGFYLWHVPVIVAMNELWPSMPLWPGAGLALVVTLAVSAGSFAVIEQPFLRLKNRFR